MGATSAAFNIIFGAKTDQLSKALKTVDGQLGRTQKRFSQIGRTMSRNVTAPLALIGATSFKVATDFQASMSKVKAVSGATGSEFKALEKDAKRLGASTRYSASEVSGLQLEYAKLGFSSSEIVKVTESTLALAQASGSDLAASAEIAGATLRGFGLEADQTGRVADVMAKAFSTSALDLGSFGEAMKYVAPVAASAGVSLEEATAMLGQLSNAGVKGSQAGTALRRILSTMAADGSSFQEAFSKSAEEVVTLGDAKDEVGRSAQSAFLILQKGMGTLGDYTGELENANGSAQEMANTMGDNTAGALANMSSAIEGAQIAIGDALAPVMLKIIGHVTDAAAAFSGLSSGTQQTIVAVAAAAAAIGPLSSSIGGMIGIGRKLIPVISKLNATMLANPYALAAAAVIALGAALYGAVKRSRQLTGAAKAESDLRRQSMEDTAEERAELNKLVAIAKSDQISREARLDAVKKLNKLSPELLGNLTLENIATKEGADALKAYNAQLIKKARAAALQEQLVAIEKELLQNQQKQAEQNEKIATAASSYVQRRQKSNLRDTLEAENEILERREYLLGILSKDAEEDAAAKASTKVEPEQDPDPAELTPTVVVEDPPEPASATVKVEPTYELEETDALSEIFNDLASEEGKIAGVFALDGDEAANAQALADAYLSAAIAAAELGELDTAQALYDQSQASQQLADSLSKANEQTEAQAEAVQSQQDVLRELANSLKTAEAQAAVFGDSFDLNAAKIDATRNALNQLITMGLDPSSEAVQRLKTQLDTLAAANTEDTGFLGSLINMEQAGQLLGQNVGQAFEQMRAANEELTAAVEAGEMTQAEATEESSKRKKQAIKQAALSTISALLAEATAKAITNAFQSASATGPAAAFVGPALAGIAAAGVAALFSSIPAFAEGGITTKEQLAIVGDNPSGREAIVPLEKLDGIVANAMEATGLGQPEGEGVDLDALTAKLEAQLSSPNLSRSGGREMRRDLRRIEALKRADTMEAEGGFGADFGAALNRFLGSGAVKEEKAEQRLSARVEGRDLLLSNERTARGRRRVRNF